MPGYIDRIENGIFSDKFYFWTWAINRICTKINRIFLNLTRLTTPIRKKTCLQKLFFLKINF
jgi:hypothetical protein